MFPALINKRITHFLRYIKNIKHQETTVHYSTSSALHSHWSRKTTSVSSVSQSCEQKVEPMNKTTAFLSVNQSAGRKTARRPISGGGASGSLRRWRVGCVQRSAAGLVGFTVEFTGELSLYQALSLNH